jgi:hypothetical protein
MVPDLRRSTYLAALRSGSDEWSDIVKTMNGIVSADPDIATEVLRTYRQNIVKTSAWAATVAREAIVHLRSVYKQKTDEYTWMMVYRNCDDVLHEFIDGAIEKTNDDLTTSMVRYDIKYMFPGSHAKPLPTNSDAEVTLKGLNESFYDRGFLVTFRIGNVRLIISVIINNVERQLAQCDEHIAKMSSMIDFCTCNGSHEGRNDFERAVIVAQRREIQEMRVQREEIMAINQFYDIDAVMMSVIGNGDGPQFELEMYSDNDDMLVRPSKLLDAPWNVYLKRFGPYLPIGDALLFAPKHAVDIVSDILEELIS